MVILFFEKCKLSMDSRKYEKELEVVKVIGY